MAAKAKTSSRARKSVAKPPPPAVGEVKRGAGRSSRSYRGTGATAPDNHGPGQQGRGAVPETPAPRPLSPRSLLLSYQRKWSDDATRFKIGCMSRQVGKDFSAGEEGIRDCFEQDQRGNKTNWLIAAPSERQSLESLAKWKEWAEAYNFAIADVIEQREGGSQSLLKSSEIQLPHGSRVIAVPGKPDTVRGFSANVLMTEFAFFEDPDATWKAILPSITNPLRGGEKKIRLISTPNGQGDRFADLWTKNHGVHGAKWSCHKVTIHDAVAAGLPIDIEELRAAIDDPEAWAQEYECEFLDAAGVLLSYELIASCESHESSAVIDPAWLDVKTPQFPRVMGIDFARKRDLSVAWTDELVADLAICREVHTMHDTSTPDQVAQLRPRIAKVARVCLDYTGPGIGLGDYLVKEFGEWAPLKHRYGKIELCTATNSLNVEMFSKLRMSFEHRSRRVPIDRAIREDLHSVYRQATKTSVSYRAPHTKDGHADRCYALALAERARTLAGTGPFQYSPINPADISMTARLRRPLSRRTVI